MLIATLSYWFGCMSVQDLSFLFTKCILKNIINMHNIYYIVRRYKKLAIYNHIVQGRLEMQSFRFAMLFHNFCYLLLTVCIA